MNNLQDILNKLHIKNNLIKEPLNLFFKDSTIKEEVQNLQSKESLYSVEDLEGFIINSNLNISKLYRLYSSKDFSLFHKIDGR